MSKFRVRVPFQHDMGSITPFVVRAYLTETPQEAALWEINSMRDHDGLARLDRLPRGVTFERIES